MMRNRKGSILVVTLGFVFVFMLLGFGTLHYTYVQNEIVEKEKASARAFWLADGAIQMAYKKIIANYNDLIGTGDYTPTNTDFQQYDVISAAESCPPPVCSDETRAQDPELPVCTDQERSMDPILCDPFERTQDAALCDAASRVPDLSGCTAEDRALDPDGLNRCPCEINNSCDYYCPCHYDLTPCVGRCPCEYDTEDPCLGRCPCEIMDPPSCPCHQTDTCPDNMVGRCPCEYSGTCCVSWVVQSYGETFYACDDATDVTCMDESRAIRARVSYDYGDGSLENALETWGDVNKDRDCQPDGNSQIVGGCLQQSPFTFETIFDKPQSWFFDPENMAHKYDNPNNAFETADNVYHNPDDGFADPGDVGGPDNPMPVQGITIVTLSGNNGSLNITEDKQLYDADGVPIASLLIVDTTESDKKNIMITVAGNGVFRGIVWIIGEGQLVGTSSIHGAVFIAGDRSDTTKVSGTTDIYWDALAIRQALDAFDGTYGNHTLSDDLKLTSWREIDTNKADY